MLQSVKRHFSVKAAPSSQQTLLHRLTGEMEQKSKLTLKALEKEQGEGAQQQIGEVAGAASGRRPSRLSQRPPDRTFISLRGLLTAQKFSKGLKERAAAKKRGLVSFTRKPVPILHEQLPAGCRRPAEYFPNSRAFQLLRDFLDSRLDSVTRDISSGGQLVRELSEEIQTLVHSVCPARFKLVCVVAVLKTGSEGVMLASRCLWDVHSDTYVSHTHQSSDFYCTVILYAVYYESR